MLFNQAPVPSSPLEKQTTSISTRGRSSHQPKPLNTQGVVFRNPKLNDTVINDDDNRNFK